MQQICVNVKSTCSFSIIQYGSRADLQTHMHDLGLRAFLSSFFYFFNLWHRGFFFHTFSIWSGCWFRLVTKTVLGSQKLTYVPNRNADMTASWCFSKDIFWLGKVAPFCQPEQKEKNDGLTEVCWIGKYWQTWRLLQEYVDGSNRSYSKCAYINVVQGKAWNCYEEAFCLHQGCIFAGLLLFPVREDVNRPFWERAVNAYWQENSVHHSEETLSFSCTAFPNST